MNVDGIFTLDGKFLCTRLFYTLGISFTIGYLLYRLLKK